MLPYNHTLYYVMGQTGKVSWCCAWINKIISKLIVWLGYLLIVAETMGKLPNLHETRFFPHSGSWTPVPISISPALMEIVFHPRMEKLTFFMKRELPNAPYLMFWQSLKLTEQAISMAHNLSLTCKWSFKKLPMFLLFNTIFKWLN